MLCILVLEVRKSNEQRFSLLILLSQIIIIVIIRRAISGEWNPEVRMKKGILSWNFLRILQYKLNERFLQKGVYFCICRGSVFPYFKRLRKRSRTKKEKTDPPKSEKQTPNGILEFFWVCFCCQSLFLFSCGPPLRRSFSIYKSRHINLNASWSLSTHKSRQLVYEYKQKFNY